VSVDDVTAWLGTQRAIAALPHSQRSHADVTVRLAAGLVEYPIDRLIDSCESALGTAVQTAVKRADEQEFARLNAEQLMFVEDASRVLAQSLDDVRDVTDYHVRVRHLESLHPHDAVATVVKGVAGGFTA
jgi:GTP cyclohydrolase I